LLSFFIVETQQQSQITEDAINPNINYSAHLGVEPRPCW